MWDYNEKLWHANQFKVCIPLLGYGIQLCYFKTSLIRVFYPPYFRNKRLFTTTWCVQCIQWTNALPGNGNSSALVLNKKRCWKPAALEKEHVTRTAFYDELWRHRSLLFIVVFLFYIRGRQSDSAIEKTASSHGGSFVQVKETAEALRTTCLVMVGASRLITDLTFT